RDAELREWPPHLLVLGGIVGERTAGGRRDLGREHPPPAPGRVPRAPRRSVAVRWPRACDRAPVAREAARAGGDAPRRGSPRAPRRRGGPARPPAAVGPTAHWVGGVGGGLPRGGGARLRLQH